MQNPTHILDFLFPWLGMNIEDRWERSRISDLNGIEVILLSQDLAFILMIGLDLPPRRPLNRLKPVIDGNFGPNFTRLIILILAVQLPGTAGYGTFPLRVR